MKTNRKRQKNQKFKDIMSLLKVNNPRSILINSPKREKNITINKTKVELSKKSTVVIKVKNEVNKEEPKVEEEENEKDADLQMPSELFSCDFIEEKSNIKEIPGEYYFESDHEAIRSNPDYLSLMKTYALLQAKKIQAVKDIEDLISARTAALSQDPRKFLTKFQAEFAKLPASQNIPDVPNIDWDKYKIPSMTNELVQKPETRNKKSVQDKPEENAKEKVEGLLDCKVERNARGQFLVRGRVFDASKPQTFNQPWTPEEQRRLEDLLLEYPSEEIEMERWKKIATCLGNRTPIQVQSRVQKYFVKLQKAGLPIPGRFRKSTPGSNSGKMFDLSDPMPSTSGLSRSKIVTLEAALNTEHKVKGKAEQKSKSKTKRKVECKAERKTESTSKTEKTLKSALNAEHKVKGKAKQNKAEQKFKSKTKRKVECKVERKTEGTPSKAPKKEMALKSALKAELKVKGKAGCNDKRKVESKAECKVERKTERNRKRRND